MNNGLNVEKQLLTVFPLRQEPGLSPGHEDTFKSKLLLTGGVCVSGELGLKEVAGKESSTLQSEY